MALPDNFSPAEHLQDVILKVQNKIVREEFNDLGDDGWESDISTPRGSLRVACTHMDSDSMDMTLLRMWLFFGSLRKCVDFHPAIFGEPSTNYQEVVKYHPQIHLHFEEKYQDVEKGYEPLRSRVSFRLMNEKAETLSKAEATTIANKIKQLFHTGTPFFWKRGKELASYIDPTKGYHFQLYCYSETEAKKVIEQVLDIQSHSPDWKFLNIRTNTEPTVSYPTIPPTKTIFGKSQRQPRKRPVGTVHFRGAVLHLHERPQPVVLVDPYHKYTDALVR
jgi:hypothetical protein